MANLINSKGVDISYWNGDINLSKVKNAGYNFVMIRCGWGNNSTSNDDSKFAANVRKAEELGMPWGVYLFSYACSSSDAKSELAHIDRLLKEQKTKGYLPTMPVAIDIEPNDTMEKNGAWNSSNLTNIATIILDGLKNLGYYPIIYTGYDELDMMNSHIRNDYDCWFAQWYTKPSSYKYNRLGIWQYGGETNYIDTPSISGVGVIDQNICYKDYPTIIKNGGYNGWKKGSSGSDTKPSGDSSEIKVAAPSIYVQGVADKWLNVAKNGATGTVGKPIVGFAVKVDNGSVWYQAHVKDGGWLGQVTGWNAKDYENGYAGSGNPAEKGKEIDGIKIYYKTPSDIINKYGYYRAAYRVHIVGGNWLDWQYDTETTNGQKGYTGILGKTIDQIEVKLVK